jgi:putative tricarboxylic transport membrane protein
MEIFDTMMTGLDTLMQWPMPLWFTIGMLNGMLFGLLPGLSGSVGIALMIPLTFGFTAEEAMALFVAALGGQTFSGSMTAILLNTPGTAPNAATTLDGYPLARQGRGGFAIGVSAAASAMGSVIGLIVLVGLLPFVREIILSFSFPEMTMLAVMGLAAIAAASTGSLVKGLISGGFGLILSFVGFSPISGELRYVFGLTQLWQGVDLIAALIGLFALSEVIRLLVNRQTIAPKFVGDLNFPKREVWEGVAFVFKHPWLLIRSSILGTGIGAVPGVGGTVASFLAYFQAVHSAKDPSMFGKGDPRGVLAPEAANDAKDAGSALPSLAFGLPGSSDWAIILGALVLHGVNPGPNLIRETPEVVWVALWVLFFASFADSILGILAAPQLVKVTRVPPMVLAPIVAVLAIVGAYALQRQFVDVIFAVSFGILGYYMRRFHIPLVPLILGLLLGDIVERSFFQSIQVFDQGIWIFFTRPISLALVIITILIFVMPVLTLRRRAHATAKEGTDAQG